MSITQHDEITIEARDALKDQVKAIVEESMEAAFKKTIPEVRFAAEIGVVNSLSDMLPTVAISGNFTY